MCGGLFVLVIESSWGRAAHSVELAFGVGPCALSEAMAWLQDHLASADAGQDRLAELERVPVDDDGSEQMLHFTLFRNGFLSLFLIG